MAELLPKSPIECFYDDAVMLTEFKIMEYKLTWRIMNFSKVPIDVNSPEFSPAPGLAFRARIYFDYNYACSRDAHFALTKVSDDDQPIRVERTVLLKNIRGSALVQASYVETYTSEQTTYDTVFFSNQTDSTLTKDILCEFVKPFQDILVVQCIMKISGHNIINEIVSKSVPVSKALKNLAQDLKRVFEEQEHTDVVLKVGENTLGAHKAVLCARSVVFEKMFQHEMLEKNNNCIEITDIEFPVLKAVVEYMYSGEVPNLTFDVALDLYPAADKYEIDGLKELCICCYENELNMERFYKLLTLAEKHSDENIKKINQKFFLKNCSEILKTAEWTVLVLVKPNMASEMLKAIT